MGLGKFWLKHGPGSPGSIAKVMAQSYSLIKRDHPQLSHEELLARALARRYTIARIASPELQERMLAAATSGFPNTKRGSFTDLIFQIMQLENPKAFPLPREVESLAVDVIHEVLDKHLPPGTLALE